MIVWWSIASVLTGLMIGGCDMQHLSKGYLLRMTNVSLIDAVKTARRCNIPSFGITNGDQTPIAKYCDSYLIASIARTSFIDSYAAPVAAINALLVACAHSQSARSLEHLRQFEEEYAASHRWYSEDAASI